MPGLRLRSDALQTHGDLNGKTALASGTGAGPAGLAGTADADEGHRSTLQSLGHGLVGAFHSAEVKLIKVVHARVLKITQSGVPAHDYESLQFQARSSKPVVRVGFQLAAFVTSESGYLSHKIKTFCYGVAGARGHSRAPARLLYLRTTGWSR